MNKKLLGERKKDGGNSDRVRQISFSAFAAAKGVKTAQCALSNAPVEFLLSQSEFYAAPFGASAFGNDGTQTRLTLELDVTNSSVLAVLHAAEESIVRKAYSDGIFEGCSLEDVSRRRLVEIPCSSVTFLEPDGMPNILYDPGEGPQT